MKEDDKKIKLRDGKQYLDEKMKSFERVMECDACGKLIGVASSVYYGKFYCPDCISKALVKKKKEWEDNIRYFEKAAKQLGD